MSEENREGVAYLLALKQSSQADAASARSWKCGPGCARSSWGTVSRGEQATGAAV